jgi:hypothetical protein
LWNERMFFSISTDLSVVFASMSGFEDYVDLLGKGLRNSKYSTYLSFENVTRYSYVISNATILYFVERDPLQALILLEQNKELLKELSTASDLNKSWFYAEYVFSYMCKYLMQLLYTYLYKGSFNASGEKDLKSRALTLWYDLYLVIPK